MEIGIGENIENLSIVVNLTKSKQLKSIKPKRSNLSNAKANFGIGFLTSRAKEAFIFLQKAFIKTLIFRHFDLKRHIQIETDILGYAISGVLS